MIKVFTRLLKKGIPFIWDEVAQKSFDELKYMLTHTLLLHPLDYHQVYFLYLAASDATIGMVLVQDDDDGTEHVVYYLSHNLLTRKLDMPMSRSWHWQLFMPSNVSTTIYYCVPRW